MVHLPLADARCELWFPCARDCFYFSFGRCSFIHSLVHWCVWFFYEQKMKIILSINMWAFCDLIWFDWKMCVTVFNGIGQWERVFVLVIFYLDSLYSPSRSLQFCQMDFQIWRESERERELETVKMCRTVAVRNSSSNGGSGNKLNEEMLSW